MLGEEEREGGYIMYAISSVECGVFVERDQLIRTGIEEASRPNLLLLSERR